MKQITLNVFNHTDSESVGHEAGELLIESSYRVVPIDRLMVATKNAIITLIEKVEGGKIDWLEGRVASLVNGELTEDSFCINNHFYSFTA